MKGGSFSLVRFCMLRLKSKKNERRDSLQKPRCVSQVFVSLNKLNKNFVAFKSVLMKNKKLVTVIVGLFYQIKKPTKNTDSCRRILFCQTTHLTLNGAVFYRLRRLFLKGVLRATRIQIHKSSMRFHAWNHMVSYDNFMTFPCFIITWNCTQVFDLFGIRTRNLLSPKLARILLAKLL